MNICYTAEQVSMFMTLLQIFKVLYGTEFQIFLSYPLQHVWGLCDLNIRNLEAIFNKLYTYVYYFKQVKIYEEIITFNNSFKRKLILVNKMLLFCQFRNLTTKGEKKKSLNIYLGIFNCFHIYA